MKDVKYKTFTVKGFSINSGKITFDNISVRHNGAIHSVTKDDPLKKIKGFFDFFTSEGYEHSISSLIIYEELFSNKFIEISVSKGCFGTLNFSFKIDDSIPSDEIEYAMDVINETLKDNLITKTKNVDSDNRNDK